MRCYILLSNAVCILLCQMGGLGCNALSLMAIDSIPNQSIITVCVERVGE